MKYTEQYYLDMKTPLSYQISEYDCGTTSILNAIRYLFKRGEIHPALIKGIELYTLDTYSESGCVGEKGTSPNALIFISNWINNEMNKFGLNIHTEIIEGKGASIDNNKFMKCMERGGVAILRVWDECQHYVLCTKVDEKCLYIFDPYFCEKDDFDDDIEVLLISNKPFEYNRIVSKKRIKENGRETFAMVKDENQIMLLMYRK